MVKNINTKLKRKVIERAHGCCEYCHSQAKFAMQSFSIEHITPQSRSGETTASNLALACQGCNNHKYTKIDGYDPITGEIVTLFHPRNQQWKDHFSWNDSFIRIIGITPTGRATVEELNLNREGLLNLRKILYEVGEHPPAAFE